jgi:hypothetical protein
VDGTKVSFEGFDFVASEEVELVNLEIFTAADKD